MFVCRAVPPNPHMYSTIGVEVPMRPARLMQVFSKLARRARQVSSAWHFEMSTVGSPQKDSFDERPFFVAPPTESTGLVFQENRHGKVPTCGSENQNRSGIEPSSFQHCSGIEQASTQPRSSIVPASFQHRSGIVPASLQHRLRPCLAAVCNAWAVAHSRAVA